MKNKLYVSLVVVLLCLFVGTEHAQLQRTNPPRQAWEYKTIWLKRAYLEDWSSWAEDGKMLRPPVAQMAKTAELGNQGWELVSITTIEDPTVSGNASYTVNLIQYYKRPK